jgi:hypothetical protein
VVTIKKSSFDSADDIRVGCRSRLRAAASSVTERVVRATAIEASKAAGLVARHRRLVEEALSSFSGGSLEKRFHFLAKRSKRVFNEGQVLCRSRSSIKLGPPVLHEYHLGRRCTIPIVVLDHQKVLTIGADIVIRRGQAGQSARAAHTV